jgi:hypothetical protein
MAVNLVVVLSCVLPMYAAIKMHDESATVISDCAECADTGGCNCAVTRGKTTPGCGSGWLSHGGCNDVSVSGPTDGACSTWSLGGGTQSCTITTTLPTTLPPTTSSTTTLSDLELLQASYMAQAEYWCKDGNGEGQYAVDNDGTCTSTSNLPEASASCSLDVSEAEKCMKFTHRNYGTDKSFAWREKYLDGAFHRACIVCVDKAISESTAASNNLGGYTLYTPKTTTR